MYKSGTVTIDIRMGDAVDWVGRVERVGTITLADGRTWDFERCFTHDGDIGAARTALAFAAWEGSGVSPEDSPWLPDLSFARAVEEQAEMGEEDYVVE